MSSGGGPERRKYPITADGYELYEEIGRGVSAYVYRAKCITLNEVVAVKVIDLERNNNDLSNISREAQTMILADHPNVLKAHCSFVNDRHLWVVMPYMANGSCLNILKAAYPDGFKETVIATVLREVLKGLEYLHTNGHIHRDVKAGNILLDARGAVKLGDFGVSAYLFDSGDRQRTRNTFVGTPCWMAPEVLEQLHGYDFKADIWSFGITALELAHGNAPFSKFPPMKVLMMTLTNSPPSLKDKKFSKSFRHMIGTCLVKDPSKRPSAHKLLKHSFFKQARSNDYINRTIIDGLSPLVERIEALKAKEEDMLAQKQMPEEKREVLSQSEYKRGISGWNFDIEDLKIRAALEVDDALPEKDTSSCQKIQLELGCSQLNPSYTSTARVENSKENVESIAVTPSLTAFCQRSKSCGSDVELGMNSSSNRAIPINGFNYCVNTIENNFNGKVEEKRSESANLCSSLERKASNSSYASDSPEFPFKLESGSQQQNQSNGLVLQIPNGLPFEATPKVSKLPEDSDAKSKSAVVQQKGRFKVTSENIEIDKASPLVLPKSQSVQAICQLSASSLPSPSGLQVNVTSASFFQHLLSILHSNILQRDYILNAMKQISTGDLSPNRVVDGSSGQGASNISEKTLLEMAHDREKELMQEINELQWRLICTQEELQRLKTRNTQVVQPSAWTRLEL